MKSAILPGLIIGILSGVWLFIMLSMGLKFSDNNPAAIEFVSILIPIIGLYYGVKRYRDNDLDGKMNFLEGLVEGFKILIVGGIFVVFIGIIYINWISNSEKANWSDFSGRIFAALLIGVLSALAVTLLLMSKSKKVD
ncbi:DUF4199 domain-containing protein [Mucilaginibacter sp. McL0603]|uniref:DUF4199 domain-containing protein n=1 Tax=Mucilaginibacter sp. McL0603 TaxID=3415670 RepID=UPI003CEDCD2A